MPASQQVAHSLKINKLKGISNLEEIRFDEKPLTAILGPNGCGKSTILHALACCYQPPEDGSEKNWRFSDWFTPTSDSTWASSSLVLTHTYREGAILHERVETSYSKAADRWKPRYERRPRRNVIFIGIQSCTPKIEEETKTSLITYETTRHQDAALIMEKMSSIFNRRYEELNVHESQSGKKYNGLALGGIRYSSLSMGAGEQRVLHILLEIFKAPKNSLILIDEIDLLLHTAALKVLLQVISQRAHDRSLQIVFTTHREVVLELSEIVSIKHLHTMHAKTYCFCNAKPDAIERLTGVQERPIEIWVEDDMARAIVENELLRLRIKRHASITPFGAAINCFTVAAGMVLRGENELRDQLFLLDGDRYTSVDERFTRIKAVLTGTGPLAEARRKEALNAIFQLVANNEYALSPEPQIHQMIKSLPPLEDDDKNEIIEIAHSIQAVDDRHNFIDSIIQRLNVDKQVGLSKIVEVASLSDYWPKYLSELRAWLEPRQKKYRE